MEEDAYAIRAIASAGLPALVSNSFSKIFSLYGERVGGLSVVCERRSRGTRTRPAESDGPPDLLQPAELWCAGGGDSSR